MMRRSAAIAAVLMLLGLAMPVQAQDAAPDAEAAALTEKIINSPPPASHNVNGATGKVRKDTAVQGGRALRVTVPEKSDQAWVVSVGNPIGKPVKAGDALVLAFWARLEKGENGATSASLPFNAVQLAADPYTPLFSQPVEIGPEWKLHEAKGKADKDYAAGALSVSLHLATGKQIVDIGPIFVLNMGQ